MIGLQEVMSKSLQLQVIGTALVLMGLAWLWVGDKEVPVKGGRVFRLFSAPRGYMRWLKWPLGLGLIYCGVEILLK